MQLTFWAKISDDAEIQCDTDEVDVFDLPYSESRRYDWGNRMEIEIRSKQNVRESGEVFTPFAIVDKMLDLLPEHCWTDPEYCFLEPSCGNGQFLVKLFERRIAAGISIEGTLNTMVGMDISSRNILDSHFRLYERACSQMAVEGTKAQGPVWFNRARDIVAIVTNNIFLVKDSLEFIKSGKLEQKPFFAYDPTGNNCVLTASMQTKRMERIAQQFDKYKKRTAGDDTGSSFTPFFKIN